MTNNEFVEKLYKKYTELVKICNFNGVYGDEVNDIIQEVFIILIKFNNINKYVKDDEPNMFIVFAIIKNYIFYKNKKNKHHYSLSDAFNVPDEIKSDEIDKYEFCITEAEKIDYWFDREIVKLFILRKISVRKLSIETNISFSVIQPIVKKFKDDIKQKLKNQKENF